MGETWGVNEVGYIENGTGKHQSNTVYNPFGLSRTIQSELEVRNPLKICEPNNDGCENFRIRRITPRECWRLMGFTDEDFDKAKEVNSNTQLYKQAGNSIVVQVLEAIFSQMMP